MRRNIVDIRIVLDNKMQKEIRIIAEAHLDLNRNMERIVGKDPQNKLHKLLDFSGRGGDIADPWYTGNFDETYRDVDEGCDALLRAVLSGQK